VDGSRRPPAKVVNLFLNLVVRTNGTSLPSISEFCVFGLCALRVCSRAEHGLGNTVDGNEFTYLFGPRITFRNSSRFQPFGELNFGGARVSLSCSSSAIRCLTAAGSNTYSKNAFALTVGGGFDIKLSKRFSIRLVQAEYLYTRFGNNCALPVCSNNNSQNSFRLKSGIVINWGGSAK
jgi:opacity protein-like surface antigen